MAEWERTLQRALLWRYLQTPGTEYCRLWRRHDGWAPEGTVTLALSNNGGFTADRTIDELGLVQHYANGWEQIASL